MIQIGNSKSNQIISNHIISHHMSQIISHRVCQSAAKITLFANGWQAQGKKLCSSDLQQTAPADAAGSRRTLCEASEHHKGQILLPGQKSVFDIVLLATNINVT